MRIAQFQFFLNLVLSRKLMGRVCRFLWELKGGQQAFGTLALNKVIIQFSNESNHVIRENERIAQFCFIYPDVVRYLIYIPRIPIHFFRLIQCIA